MEGNQCTLDCFPSRVVEWNCAQDGSMLTPDEQVALFDVCHAHAHLNLVEVWMVFLQYQLATCISFKTESFELLFVEDALKIIRVMISQCIGTLYLQGFGFTDIRQHSTIQTACQTPVFSVNMKTCSLHLDRWVILSSFNVGASSCALMLLAISAGS